MIPMTDHKSDWTYSHEYDGGDRACGLLITELAGFFRGLPPGDLVCVIAHDLSAWIDIPAWCRLVGHGFVDEAPLYYLLRRN
jgi:tRNA 2-thiouridine synthesizing protein A